MSLEDQIGSLTQAATDLTTTVSTKIADIDARVASAKQEMDSFIAAAAGGYPYINLLRDSGRFTDVAQDPHDKILTGVFDASQFSTANGTPPPVEAGKFIHGNSTFGGSGAELNQTVADLINATGRTADSAIFGREFYVAEFTMGAGTVFAGVNSHYGMFRPSRDSISGHGKHTSFAVWARLITGSVLIRHLAELAINGIDQEGHWVPSPADGWFHVAGVSNSGGRGYLFDFEPGIYAQEGAQVQVAMPVFYAAKVLLPVHTHPVPSI